MLDYFLLYAYDVQIMFGCRQCLLGAWFIMFKVLTLNVTIFPMITHLSKFGLVSVANVLNTMARAPT